MGGSRIDGQHGGEKMHLVALFFFYVYLYIFIYRFIYFADALMSEE